MKTVKNSHMIKKIRAHDQNQKSSYMKHSTTRMDPVSISIDILTGWLQLCYLPSIPETHLYIQTTLSQRQTLNSKSSITLPLVAFGTINISHNDFSQDGFPYLYKWKTLLFLHLYHWVVFLFFL